MFNHPNKKKRKPETPKSGASAGKSVPDVRNLENFVVEEIELSDSLTPQQRPSQYRTPPRWWPAVQTGAAVLSLLAIVVAAGLVTRSAWPTDETRFLAIAWEMWIGDWRVPRLNGAPAGMAPLFFWVVNLGWQVFGVVEWWARLLPVLFMLGSLFLAARMARFLWPSEGQHARYTPLALLGGFYWVSTATLLTIDLLTVFFSLAALSTLLWMWRARDQRVWLLLGPVFGLGLLASGSLVFLYVLPVVLLAPMWARGTPTMPWPYWYLDIFKAAFVGFVFYFAWAIPTASDIGWPAVLQPLFSPLQTYSLDLFAGARPWWWYLFLLPWLTFPWALWPLPWLRLWHIRREPISNGLAFCMVWVVATLALLSLFEIKEPQFLLPLLPAFFLVGSWLLLDENHTTHDHSRLISTMIFPLILLGGLLAVLPGLPRVPYLPEFLWQLSPFVGVAIIGVGVAVGWLPLPAIETRIVNMAVTVVVLTTLALLVSGWQFTPHYEVSGAARVLATAQQQGVAVAHVGAYHGQYHFAGQLRQPLTVITPQQLELWVVGNPDGLVVTYQPQTTRETPLYEQPYGDTHLRIWPAAALKGS